MAEINEWQFYFDQFAPEYDKEEYALTWREEVDFMEEVFQLPTSTSIRAKLPRQYESRALCR